MILTTASTFYCSPKCSSSSFKIPRVLQKREERRGGDKRGERALKLADKWGETFPSAFPTVDVDVPSSFFLAAPIPSVFLPRPPHPSVGGGGGDRRT